MIKKLLPLLLPFIFLHLKGEAQFFFRPGYSVGLCNPHEINRVIYIHNQVSEDLYSTGKKMPEIKTFGGISIAIGSESDRNTGWELHWQNKHDIVKSRFEFNGETIERDLKIRSNMLSIGFYGGKKHWAAGGSLDFGNFKGMYKRAPKDSIRKADYVYVFQAKQVFSSTTDQKEKSMLLTTQIGATVFAQYSIGPFGARLFYQMQFMGLGIDNLDNKLLGHDIQQNQGLNDHFNNFGLMFYLKVGGYKD